MSILIAQQAPVAMLDPAAADLAPRRPSFFARLIRAREEAAKKHVARYLAGQSTERLKNGLGLSDEDIRVLCAGEPRVPAL